MKKIIYALMGTAMIFAATGCSSQKASTAETTAQAQDTEITSQESASESEIDTTVAETDGVSSGEVTIEHSQGSTTIAVNPQKSVVFDLGVLDIIDALGVETELAVPVDSLTTYLSKYSDAVNAGGIKEPNLETIFEFEPDVIFISGRQQDYYDELSLIAPTVYVDLNTATYMEDFAVNVTNIGAIYGKSEEAAKELAKIEELIASGQQKAAASDKKALILLTNDGSMSAYGKGSRFGLIHDVLGIKTVDDSIEVSTHGQEASYEYVAQVNPDLLFIVDRTAVVGGTQEASSTLDNELIQSTNAAKNNKIIYLDAEAWYLSGGGINSIQTMVTEAIAALD